MSSDFLSENNNCGQTILRLVSRGNAIIAELLRLSEFVPVEFSPGPDTPKEERDRLELLLPDFSYFQKPDLCEARIDQNASLQVPNDSNTPECIFHVAFDNYPTAGQFV